MFDAKSLLENLVKGGQSGGAGPTGDSGLADLIGQVLPGAKTGQGGQLGDLEGMLNSIVGGSRGKTDGASGGLSDIGDMLGSVLGQATSGVKDGASKLDDATGMGDIVKDLAAKYGGGRSPEELLGEIKKVMEKNKLGTGAALGGLGALILGTQSGRSLAVNAAKLGALTLIGGLAYKAYQNHQAGRPLINTAETPDPAPTGSGFEADAASNDDAMLYIKAMIAAAAADGRIDSSEQQKILGSLPPGSLEGGAEEFLANEMNAPASVQALAASAGTREQAVQTYTAARIAINPDTYSETGFLKELADALGLEADLASHIDAVAANMA